MKKSILLVALTAFALAIAAQPRFGKYELWNSGWKFKLQGQSDKQTLLQDNSYRDWRAVTLPHDWSIEGPYSPSNASATGFLPGGIGWYEKSFTLPAGENGKRVYLYFEGIYNRSHIYVNGQVAGGRPNGYLPILCDLTPYLHEGENSIKVEVDHSRFNDSRWYTGSGIYRNVYLVYAHPVHKALWGDFCRVKSLTATRAELLITTTLLNESGERAVVKVNCTLIDNETGRPVATTTQSIATAVGDTTACEQKMTVKNPKIWDLERPNLYTLVTTLTQEGRELERSETLTGLRSIRFDADKGFFLNGKNLKLKGVCIHHDAGILGAAVPAAVWRQRLAALKEVGCNAIRTSHNPQADELYDLCDEMGLLVMDEGFDEWEFPKKKWIEGWNKGTPGYDGSYDFFGEWGVTDIKDMVIRDRNHPCIILWSIGNEVDYPNDPYSHQVLDTGTINQPVYGGYLPDHPRAERLGAISKRLADAVRSCDTTRPVTAALAGVIMSNYTDYPSNLDVCGYNYTENRYEMDHATYPRRIIYGSENGHGLDSWGAVTHHDYIAGQFLWTGIDYLGESHEYSRGSTSGLIDYAGFIKPIGYWRRALWSEQPCIYAGSYRTGGWGSRRGGGWLSNSAYPLWNYNEGETVRVVVYSNTPSSRLLLNGSVAGETQPLDKNSYITYWDIPYQAGALTAEGLDAQGNVVCRYSLHSSDRPAAIVAAASAAQLKKETGVALIEVQIVDEKGNFVFLSDDEVTCRIEGPLRLLGMENGNSNDMGSSRDSHRRVWHGRLRVYVQALDQTGEAVLTLSAPWLKEAQMKIEVK